MKENNWYTLWNGRTVRQSVLEKQNPKEIYMELKRGNGYDSMNQPICYEAFLRQHHIIKNELSYQPERDTIEPIHDVFDVGCGSGSELLLYLQENIVGGGCDYSEGLISGAKKILDPKQMRELYCADATQININETYDAVYSRGVFSYFTDFEYAEQVLIKMVQKCRRSVGIIDVLDSKKQEAFIQYRKSHMEDYEERYKDLPKLFYPKEFFLNFAEKHNLDIRLERPDFPEYWNSEFGFNCFMYK